MTSPAPSPSASEWIGLSGWFVDYLTGHPELMAEQYRATWFRATVEVRAGLA